MTYEAFNTNIDDFEIIHLIDNKNRVEVKIVKDIGNTLFSYKVKGKEFMYFPFSLKEYSENKAIAGNPFLYPYANRLENNLFQFENIKYEMPDNVTRDQFGQPSHGILLKDKGWDFKSVRILEDSVEYVSELDFTERKDLFSLYPFYHRVTLKFILSNGNLTVETILENLDTKNIPISFGFHPYFNYEGYEREEVILEIPAKMGMELSDKFLPTGQFYLIEKKYPDHERFILGNYMFDTGFFDLNYNENGMAKFVMEKSDSILEVHYSKEYPIALLYAPMEKKLLCIEPMTLPTNGINMMDNGSWNQGVKLKPKESFTAKFKIVPRVK